MPESAEFRLQIGALKDELLRPELGKDAIDQLANGIAQIEWMVETDASQVDIQEALNQLAADHDLDVQATKHGGATIASRSDPDIKVIVGAPTVPGSNDTFVAIDKLLGAAANQQDGRVTVIGALGHHFASNLASNETSTAVYRYVYPGSKSFDRIRGRDVSPSQLRMLREGEYKTLIEWRMALSQRNEVAPDVRQYISQFLTDTSLVFLEPEDEPATLCLWSETLNEDVLSVLPGTVLSAVIVPTGSIEFTHLSRYIESVIARSMEYRQYVVYAKLCTNDDVVAPPNFPEPTRKLFYRFDDGGPDEEDNSDEDIQGSPISLVILTAPGFDGQRGVFLQRRDPRNSTDAFGKLSLLSTRIYANDFVASLNDADIEQPINLQMASKTTPPTSTQATGLLYNRLEGGFGPLGPRMRRYPIPAGAFRRAVRRECYSSLGIDVDDRRIRRHSIPRAGEMVGVPERRLLPELFTVRLSFEDGEIADISKQRPFSNLVWIPWPDGLTGMKDENLNGFLRKNRKREFFTAILDEVT